MKAFLPLMILVLGFAASVSTVQAETTSADNVSKNSTIVTKSGSSCRPGGGWDLNNLRISVSHTKLIGSVGTGIEK